MTKNQVNQERLDSWKEIAAYLKRDVRTVIRWEKERELPVRRVPGGHKQAVFAYRDEIDTWLQRGKPNTGTEPEPVTESPIDGLEPSRESDRSPQRAIVIMIAVGFACGILALTAMVVRSRRVNFRPVITKISSNMESSPAFRTDGSRLYFTQSEGGRHVLKYAPMSGHPVQALEMPFDNVGLMDFSNDHRTLLLAPYQGIEAEKNLWTVPAQGGTPKQLGSTLCHDARWSPDNTRIACATMTSILLLDSAGTVLETIGSFSVSPYLLAWSPDGQRLRVSINDPSTQVLSAWEIAIAGAPATGFRPAVKLPWGENCCTAATWTRDGTIFIYATVEPTGRTRLMMRREGTLWRSPAESELPLRISPWTAVGLDKTGSTIYMQTTTATRSEMLRFDSHKKSFQPFLSGVPAESLSFSRDRKWLAYVNFRDKSLWRSRVDGTELRQLTRSPMKVLMASISPDGGRIAFTGQQPGKPYRIYLVSSEGGDLQEAADGTENQGAPSWSDDGSSIVYGDIFCEQTQDCWVRRVNLNTHKAEIIPGSHNLRTARWSPDGKYIAALQPVSHELLLLDVATHEWKVLTKGITGDNINWSADSRFIFADCPLVEAPRIERVNIKDGQRTAAASLIPLQRTPGEVHYWFGLNPDDDPIVFHIMTSSELYALEWKNTIGI